MPIVAESVAGKIAVNTYRPGLFARQWNDTCFNQSIPWVVVLQFVIKSPTYGIQVFRLLALAARNDRQVW
jgi:hypothetical protein